MNKLDLKCILYIIITLNLTIKCLAQENKKLDVNKLDQTLIHNLFLNLLNKHRDSLGLTRLNKSSVLDQAAKCQSDYMASNLLLSHTQPDKLKSTPSNRVNFFNGNFSGIGENCLFMPLTDPFKIKDNVYQIKSYADLAYCMFLSWRYSPGHYKNMINSTFFWSGLQITYDHKTEKIYATNVFGSTQYNSPKIFPPKFSIGNIIPDENHLFSMYANELFSKSAVNFTYMESNKTSLYHNKINEVKSIINATTDGILVDYVLREQFTCQAENNLNNSPIYDGWPQKPIYATDFYANNKSSKIDELNTTLANIPNELQGSLFQPNIIIIKNNTAINYTIPITVMQEDFRVLDFNPIIDTTGIYLADTTINFQISYRIYFHKGTAIPIDEPNDNITSLIYKDDLPKDAIINKVVITGYSSIEGDSVKNHSLQIRRSNYLKTKLIEITNIDTSKIVLGTAENKLAFIMDYGNLFNYNDSLSVRELKNIYKNHKNEINEDLLKKHRYTEINFSISIPLNSNSSDNSLKELHEHISALSNHYKLQLLKITLLRLQERNLSFDISANNFNWLDDQNQLLPLYFYSIDSTCFRRAYIENQKKKKWDEKDNYNFIIANFRYYQTYSKIFISLNDLEHQISALTTKTASDTLKKLLWLNFHLIKAHYSRELKNEKEVSLSLEKFKNIYYSFSPKIEDLIKIGLFFNYFNRFNWTLDLLKSKLDIYKTNEELWFIYLSTYSFLGYPTYDNAILNKLIQRCIGINQIRFCHWINEENFQLLRNPLFKEAYCKNCNEKIKLNTKK